MAHRNRRKIRHPFIHPPGCQQRAIQRRAGFDMHLVDALAAELQQQSGQIDTAIGARQFENLRTGRFQCSALCRISFGTGNECAAVQNPGVRRRRQATVDNHFQRLTGRLNVTHVHLRVVRQQRATAGQDDAGAGAPALHIGARGGAGDPF